MLTVHWTESEAGLILCAIMESCPDRLPVCAHPLAILCQGLMPQILESDGPWTAIEGDSGERSHGRVGCVGFLKFRGFSVLIGELLLCTP